MYKWMFLQKKTLAEKFNVTQVPSVVMMCDGEKLKDVDYSMDIEKLASQIFD